MAPGTGWKLNCVDVYSRKWYRNVRHAYNVENWKCYGCAMCFWVIHIIERVNGMNMELSAFAVLYVFHQSWSSKVQALPIVSIECKYVDSVVFRMMTAITDFLVSITDEWHLVFGSTMSWLISLRNLFPLKILRYLKLNFQADFVIHCVSKSLISQCIRYCMNRSRFLSLCART